jgi:lipoprotein-anchoring transpeptidase ErfK/SrfK
MRETNRRSWRVFGVTAALAALAVLGSACTGGSTTTSGTPSAAAAPAVNITIDPAGNAPVSPKTPVVVKAANGTLTKVTVTNHAKGNAVAGSLSADKTIWTSTEPLGYGASYDVVADGTDTAGKTREQTGTVQTVTPSATAYPSLIPAPTTTLTFGVGQIIGVSFDHDITDRTAVEKALSVTSTPPQTGAWSWIDKRTVHYRPQTYWQAGTKIAVNANLYGVDLGGGVYGKADRTATYTIHDSWIAQADGATEQMRILHNGQEVKNMPISLGSPGFPTHEGPHVISDKQPSIIMDSCTYGVCAGQPGYYREKVDLDLRISNDGEFVHSAPWSVGQQGSSNVSHGCVNLSPDNAQWFFNNFNLGDVVEITHSGGVPLKVWDTYGDWELSWSQWLQGSALH